MRSIVRVLAGLRSRRPRSMRSKPPGYACSRSWPLGACSRLRRPVPREACCRRSATMSRPPPSRRRRCKRLEQLMTKERIFRQEGLTIGTMASRLAVPEERLRRAIHEGLGYRNFNAFINHYRLEDAKTALSDPTQHDVPVVTIAMDAGFRSLGPFNRAFKADTGITPTEYRRMARSALSSDASPSREADRKIG